MSLQFSDLFQRADEFPVASPWELLDGTWNIEQQQVVHRAGAGSGQYIVVADAGVSDFFARWTFVDAGTVEGGIVWRVVDNDNYMLLVLPSGALYHKTAGSFNALGVITFTPAVSVGSDVIAIKAVGSNTWVYHNGVLAYTSTSLPNHSTGTKFGFRSYSGNGVRFSGIQVYDPGDTFDLVTPDGLRDVPVAEYRFNDDLLDASDLSNDAVINGTTTYGTAPASLTIPGCKSLVFDGATHARLGVFHNLLLPKTTTSLKPAAFSIWFKTSATGKQVLVYQAGDWPAAGNTTFAGGLEFDASNNLYASAYYHSGGKASPPGSYNDGNWHCAYVEYDGHYLSINIDGKVTPTETGVAQSGYAPSYAFSLGAGRSTVDSGVGEFVHFIGELANPRFYNKPLSPLRQVALVAGDDPHAITEDLFLTSVKGASDNSYNLTTAPRNTTGATLLVASIASYGGVGTLTDSEGNTWTALTRYGTLADANVQLFYCQNPTTSEFHTFEVNSTAAVPRLSVIAFSGTATSSVFDQESGSAQSYSATTQPGSITPSTNARLIVTATSGYGNYPISINAGFGIAESGGYAASHLSGGIAYTIQPVAAAVNPTWTWTDTSVVVSASASFNLAGGVSPPTGSALAARMRRGLYLGSRS